MSRPARDERHAVAAVPAGALCAAQAAATAFRKRAVIAGKYNHRVVGKSVAADGVKQPANTPVKLLYYIAVGARPEVFAKAGDGTRGMCGAL